MRFRQTGGCIFGGNSPFSGTPEPDFCLARGILRARKRCFVSMSQPYRASEQLRQYLAQLMPQVRGRVLGELERLLELGEPIPRAEELIASLRAEFPDGPERLGDPERLFFRPLEPVLVDGAPERANSGQIARGSLR